MTTRPESFRSSSAARMACGYGGDGVEGLLLADFDVDDDLGEDFEIGGELGDGLAGAGDEVEDDERGEEAVAGGGEVREEDVAGLLAAEGGVVARASARGRSGRRPEREACGCRERLSAASRPMLDMVVATTRSPVSRPRALRSRAAMSRMASPLTTLLLCAGEHAAVGVAVEGDAEVGAACGDFGGDEFGMEGAAVVVDVAAVGGDVERG